MFNRPQLSWGVRLQQPLSQVHSVYRRVAVCAIGLCALGGCGNSRRETPKRTADASASAAVVADTVGCELASVSLYPDSEALLREFVRRDAAGEFTRTSAWFAAATTCPGHEPAPDVATMARDPRIRVLDRTPESLRAEVRWERLMVGDAKVSGPEIDTLVAVRTPFGWRVRSPVLVPHVPPPPRPTVSGGHGAPAT